MDHSIHRGFFDEENLKIESQIEEKCKIVYDFFDICVRINKI